MANPPPAAHIVPLTDEARAQSLRETLARAPAPGPLRVFGYGSLMWKPCFPHVRRSCATLHGYHRDFSIWSVLGRGTPECPGLGFGLERRAGAECIGILYDLPDGTDLDPLWAAIAERRLPVVLHIGGGRSQLKKAWHSNGRPRPKDIHGGGENLRAKDLPFVHQGAEIFLGVLALGVLAHRQAAHLEILERGLHPGGRKDGLERGIDRAVTFGFFTYQVFLVILQPQLGRGTAPESRNYLHVP